jgi:hypothetical protein
MSATDLLNEPQYLVGWNTRGLSPLPVGLQFAISLSFTLFRDIGNHLQDIRLRGHTAHKIIIHVFTALSTKESHILQRLFYTRN